MARYHYSFAPVDLAELGAVANRAKCQQMGIALVLVLWVLALLVIVALGLAAAQRTETALATNQVSSARFRAGAEAAINWSVLNLLKPATTFEENEHPWLPDGSAHSWEFSGDRFEIRVSDETSRINLNTASQGLLTALFVAASVSRDEASALADAIQDWRDTDDLVQLNGAEDSDYEQAGRIYGAKDAPFESVEELQLVLGMDPQLYRIVASAITVAESGGDPRNQEFAPPLVRAALKGISLEELLLQHEEESEEHPDSVGLEPKNLNRGGPIYRIQVTRLDGGHPGLGMEAVVHVESEEDPPVRILWRYFGVHVESSLADYRRLSPGTATNQPDA